MSKINLQRGKLTVENRKSREKKRICFADINVLQGSVATHARCGGISDIHLTANLPKILSVKTFLKSVKN